MKEIFKIDSKEKLRVIQYSTDGDKLIAESGLEGGNLVRNEKICKPKNIGKTNETTGAQQAISEMDSKITLKTRGEYFYTAQEAWENENQVLPMLAKEYNKESHKVIWEFGEVFTQPKLDGIRCLAIVTDTNVTLKSRSGLIINTMPHIESNLLFSKPGIYDGELYAHGLSFQENIRLIKKNRGKASRQIKLHVYDLYFDQPFSDRLTELYDANMHSEHVTTVKTTLIRTEEDLKAQHLNYLAEGYEGAMLRWGKEAYKSKGRSSHLLKYKHFQDMQAIIIDVIPSDARPEQGVLVCDDNGVTFKATPKMSHYEKSNILINKDKIIGKTAEIRYFGKTESGRPRFPVAVAIK